MGICVNKITCIQSKKEKKSINKSSAIDYFVHNRNQYDTNENNYQIYSTSKSFLKDALESPQLINYSLQLIQKMCESIKIESKVNGTAYQSIGINKLSECKTEDEQRYLYNQNKVIIDWSLIFADYYNKTQIMKEKVEEEKISQIMCYKELSTFTNEIVTEINNNICTTINDLKTNKKRIHQKKNNKRAQKKSNLNQPKHSRVKSTNFNLNPNITKNIKINLNTLMNINSPVSTQHHITNPAYTDCVQKMRQKIKNKLQFNQRKSFNALSSVNYDQSSRNKMDNCLHLSNSTLDDDLLEELMKTNTNQPNTINTNPLFENKHIIHIEDMKIALNDFKNKNFFLFVNKSDY